MRRCLVDLYGLDMASSYQHAFVYIRQLAIHLRNALTLKQKESYKHVYNWQYVNCLKAWGSIIASYPDENQLKPLVYPLVQVITGTIRLVPTSKYFPLRFHCIQILIQLAMSTRRYIPIAPMLLEMLSSSFLSTKPSGSTQRPPKLISIVRLSKKELNSRITQDAIIEKTFLLLKKHYEVYEFSIGFPELSFPTIIVLKKFIRKCKVTKWRNEARTLLKTLNNMTENIIKKRQQVSFAPCDINSVDTFLSKEEANARVLRAAKDIEEQEMLEAEKVRTEALIEKEKADAQAIVDDRQIQKKQRVKQRRSSKTNDVGEDSSGDENNIKKDIKKILDGGDIDVNDADEDEIEDLIFLIN